jgi:general secretion pathway protein N
MKAIPLQTSPTQPPLVLVGAIAGESDGIAIFQDKGTKSIIRLKPGESHGGWTLQTVKAREATLQNEQRGAVLALPTPSVK